MAEIRCGKRKFATITENGILEVFCNSVFCKTYATANEVVIHRFDVNKINADGTIKLIETKRFKRPT